MKNNILCSAFGILSMTNALLLSTAPSDHGRPSDYKGTGGGFLDLNSTFGFVVFLIVGVLCIAIFAGLSNSEDKSEKGCAILVALLLVIGCLIKCS